MIVLVQDSDAITSIREASSTHRDAVRRQIDTSTGEDGKRGCQGPRMSEDGIRACFHGEYFATGHESVLQSQARGLLCVSGPP